MSGSRIVRAVPAALLCAALLAGCSGSRGGAPAPSASPGTAAPSRGAGPTVSDRLQDEYQKVVRDVLPSVVQITAGQSLGSGIVYDTSGDIVTNAHVVGDSTAFKVTLATGGGSADATLVGSYPADDLAVIRLRRPPGGLKPAVFGDSAKVEVGQITLAMGNPLGLSSSVTQGIVSAVGRTVSEGGNGGGNGATIANMVQTSAAINPGNSGGALVNLSSQVIGIPTLAATDPELGNSAAPGIGFAIPASTVTDIAGQLVKNGKVTNSGRAALGVTVRTVLGDNFQPAGVAIVSVKNGGAADKAGLRPDDVITKLDATPVTTAASLTEVLAAHRPGDHVTVTYTRDGSRRTAGVTLGQL
ncbi:MULTISPECIES: S1C family serine protease [Streptomycetaceae]|uniref:Putative secreted serine protease n=1 Tax=Streptantibioticus cattleyicolor (strain ATCC 35852 / DSM 46488 / JCM 4925 / NBRC 14057 / NRRL 8057) TaxID=1003195 RepID=F8K0Z4_STREN|nr:MULTISPECIES: trypsin-like peptidase domain-containing protein [Streptomycetaceae]AEW93666.1 putative secreted serine protease [Streptantibioticus cattleyicolor NRRL 8057 = DSM 46488]MYS58368.1 PDZ domain-containing protein [Streptomyces sp. SID5468]CCB74016.1 putative secreted protease [Streptantibioticus cattleyicolor NRRL 8057 = DSM 46488]